MGKDNGSGRNWSALRSSQSLSKVDAYLHIPGTSFNKEGLHKNCSGCEHILAKACKFVRFPRVRKWPCYFREEIKNATGNIGNSKEEST
jgi:hypothetical protein